MGQESALPGHAKCKEWAVTWLLAPEAWVALFMLSVWYDSRAVWPSRTWLTEPLVVPSTVVWGAAITAVFVRRAFMARWGPPSHGLPVVVFRIECGLLAVAAFMRCFVFG